MIQINKIKLVNQVSDHQVHQRGEGHLQHRSILGQEGKNVSGWSSTINDHPGWSSGYKTFNHHEYDQHFPGIA